MVTANQPSRTGAASAAGPPSAPREHAQRNSHAHAFALEGVLQPDFTFTAPPLLQMLHGQLFACCAVVSLVFLATSLPFAGPTTPKAPGTWLKVLLPLILYTVASIGVHCAYIGSRRRALRMQLGPEPDASITVAAASVQWAVLHRCFSRQHAASNASDIVFLAGVLCSLGILLASLQASGSAAYRAAAIPLAVAEFLVLCIHTVYRVRCASIVFEGASGHGRPRLSLPCYKPSAFGLLSAGHHAAPRSCCLQVALCRCLPVTASLQLQAAWASAHSKYAQRHSGNFRLPCGVQAWRQHLHLLDRAVPQSMLACDWWACQ